MKRSIRFDMYLAAINDIARRDTTHRYDANETATFARQLEDIDAQLYRVQYPTLKGSLLVPVKADIDPGAEQYTYRIMDYAGTASVIANYADDLPRSDIQGREVKNNLFGIGAAYGYSLQDLRRSKFTGLGLEVERAMAAREVLARKHDAIIATGDSGMGVTGFLNNADVQLVTAAFGNWIGGTATADQVTQDLFKMERTIITDSKGVEMPDTLVLPPSLYAYASTVRIANTEVSALEYFLKKSSGIKSVDQWYPLETAGAGSVPRIVAYTRNPMKLQALMPLEFNQSAPEARNLAFVINCDGRAGGVIFRYPGSARYMDGC